MNQLIQVLKKRWQKYVTQHEIASHPKLIIQANEGKYFQDALNLSPYEIDEADLTMDLCSHQSWPWKGVSRWGQSLSLKTQQLEKIVIQKSPLTKADWQALCINGMALLIENGHLIFELPISELDVSGPQGPQFKSGMDVLDSFMDRFWRSNNWTHRLAYLQSAYLNAQGEQCEKENASRGQLVLVKRLTTSQERTIARVALPSFGRNRSK